MNDQRIVQKLRRRLLLGLAIGLIVVALILIASDADQMSDALQRLKWHTIPIVIGLVVLNYVLRYVKWEYYLRRSHIDDLNHRDSSLVFLSGFSMAMTPGKVGELLKAYLVHIRIGLPVARTIPIIFAERVTDAAAVLVLSGVGLLLFRYGWPLFIIAVLLLVVLLAGLHNERFGERLLSLLQRTRVGRGRLVEMQTLLRSARNLLTPTPLISMLVLSVISWFFECIALWVILRSLGIDGGWSLLAAATFVFATSAWIGGLTLIPGGLGATEASAAALLVLTIDDPAMTGTTAAVATLLLRFATLWFGVAIGIIALLVTSRWTPEATATESLPYSEPAINEESGVSK